METEEQEYEYQPNFVRIALIMLCVCIAVAALVVAGSINYLSYAVPDEIAKTREDLKLQIRDTRDEAAVQIAATRNELNAQLFDTRKQVLALTDKHLRVTEAHIFYELDNARQDLNERLSDTNGVINNALYHYDEDIRATVGAAFERIDPIASDVTNTLDKVDSQEEMIYSRYLATTGELNKTLDAVRRMSEEGAKAAPQVTADITSITGYVAGFTKPKPPQGFFGRLKSHLATIATIAVKVAVLK